MLYITTASNKNYEWHVGEKKPEISGTIKSLQADGDELNKILNGFSYIPSRNNRNVQTWVWEMAEYIWVNL